MISSTFFIFSPHSYVVIKNILLILKSKKVTNKHKNKKNNKNNMKHQSSVKSNKNYNSIIYNRPPQNFTPSVSAPTTSISSGIRDGFAMGLGSQVASRINDSVMGPRKVEVQHTYNSSDLSREKCLSIIKLLEPPTDMLQQCQKLYPDIQTSGATTL
jgi:hypothetical protein